MNQYERDTRLLHLRAAALLANRPKARTYAQRQEWKEQWRALSEPFRVDLQNEGVDEPSLTQTWTAVTSGLHTAVGPNNEKMTVTGPRGDGRFAWAVTKNGQHVAAGTHTTLVGAKHRAERARAANIGVRRTGSDWTPLVGRRPV